MFKTQPSDNQLILITFILVVLMAVPTFQTLTQKDPVIEMAQVATTAVVSQERTPASIPKSSVKSQISKAVSYFANYDLNCSGKVVKAATVTGGFVQLQGKNCLKNFKDGDIQIINKTNGFTASIFTQGTDKYQTDLIQLQAGENVITIRYQQSSGKSTEEVVRIQSSSI